MKREKRRIEEEEDGWKGRKRREKRRKVPKANGENLVSVARSSSHYQN